MARTDVPIIDASRNAVTTATPTAADATNGHKIQVDGGCRRVVLVVKQTAATAKTVTVKAGANPPAWATDADLVSSALAQNATVAISLDFAKFVQSNGDINVDLQAGFTGEISAIRIPK